MTKIHLLIQLLWKKIEPIKVSINESTGQVQTMEIYRFLKSLILPL